MGITCIWLLFVFFLLENVFTGAHGPIDNVLKLSGNTLARFSSLNPDPKTSQFIGENFKQLATLNDFGPTKVNETDFAYQIWSSSGELLTSSNELNNMPLVKPNSSKLGVEIEMGEWVVMAIASPNQKVIAVVGYTKTFYGRLKRGVLIQTLIPYTILLGTLSVVLWFALRVGLLPLRELALQLVNRQYDNLTPLLPSKNYLEISPIIAALNEKMQLLEKHINTERGFFADAAHELRTPLAALSAQAHLVLTEKNPTKQAEALEQFQSGINRTALVLSKLLQLAKFDSQQGPVKLYEVDLVKIIRNLIAEYTPRAFDQNKLIELEAPDRAYCLCDDSAIRIAVDNLIDNALQYSPSGSLINVVIKINKQAVEILVIDNGLGIAEQDRDKIFERFERLNLVNITGSGLGLSIVKRIVNLHSGSINVSDGPNGLGTTFTITLPHLSDVSSQVGYIKLA